MSKLAETNGFRSEDNGVVTSVVFYTPEIVRVTKTPADSTATPFVTPTVILKPETVKVEVQKTGDTITAESFLLKVVLDRKTGAISFVYRNGNRHLLAEDAAAPFKMEPVEYPSGKTNTVTARFRVDPDEEIYGFGQPQNDKFSQRGSKFPIHQGYRFVSVPMFQTVKGYGVFLDNPASGEFEEKDNVLNFMFKDGENLDYYFMYGGSTDGVVAQMRKLTGDTPMQALWTLGFWQSRERYKTQAELLEVVEKYRQLHIPLDGIIQDWQYWGENNDYWNAMQFLNPGFPEPKKMFDRVHELNAHAMLVIWPDFGQKTEQFKVMKEKGFLLDIDTWPNSTSVGGSGGARPYDPYGQEARDIYWSYAKKLLDYGPDAWWMDSTEPDHHNIKDADFDLPTALGTFRRVRNLYPFYTTGGVYEHQRADDPEGKKRIFILTRCAYAGQQRFGTNTWSGDTVTSWDSLKDQIACGLNMSLVGLPYWNADIGGFFLWNYPNRSRNIAFAELYARWMQFGAFTPMMRSHGTDGPREIYYFGSEGEPVYDAMVRAIRTRYAFLPYIYSMMYDVSANRGSMMRPLFADFPKDKKTHKLETEFLFGKSLLVAPVLKSMYLANNRIDVRQTKNWDVYLPEGSSFYDFHTGRSFSGGQTVSVAAPLDLVPLFVKAGSIIPVAEPVEYAEQKKWDDLEIRVYPGADGTFTLYEDEFDNYNYEKGAFSTIKFTYEKNRNTLTIGDVKGSFPGMLKERTFRIVKVAGGVGVGENRTPVEKCKTVKYTGKSVSVTLD
ncbi:MAG: DUF5110 domain-containing protein [Lentisphaeria bacterium]|nr:DUF5110 domain-containing protein [Lentisphaeria bacterium]